MATGWLNISLSFVLDLKCDWQGHWLTRVHLPGWFAACWMLDTIYFGVYLILSDIFTYFQCFVVVNPSYVTSQSYIQCQHCLATDTGICVSWFHRNIHYETSVVSTLSTWHVIWRSESALYWHYRQKHTDSLSCANKNIDKWRELGMARVSERHCY